MTVCPIAIFSGCKSCPVVSVCPAKGLIGDYVAEGKKAEAKPAPKKPAAKKPQ